MGKIELIMPKMGESVAEATIIKWLKNVGDAIEIVSKIGIVAKNKNINGIFKAMQEALAIRSLNAGKLKKLSRTKII